MRAIAWALLAVSGIAAGAGASPELRVSIAPDSCPSPKALVRALEQAVPGAKVVLDPAGPIEIIDVGARYRVTVAGESREFGDRARRCGERARAAAVFVALQIESHPLAPTPPPAPPVAVAPVAVVAPAAIVAPVTVAVRAPPPAPLAGDLHLDAEAGGVVANDFAAQLSGGAGARLVGSWRFVGLALGVSGLSPVTLSIDRGTAVLSRVPVDLDLRGQLRRGRFEAAAEVGIALVILSVNGQGFATDHGATVLDVGLRTALLARFWLSGRIALYAAIETISGRSRPLALADGATVGTTPSSWLSLALGLAIRIR